MGLIREPLDVDFYIDSRPYTEEEERLLSEFIRNQKLKNAQPETSVTRPTPTFRPIARKKKEYA
jgi:hypothetical protein